MSKSNSPHCRRAMSSSTTMSPSTKVNAPPNWCANAAPGFCLCRPTTRTSIPSKWPSRSSRPCCESVQCRPSPAHRDSCAEAPPSGTAEEQYGLRIGHAAQMRPHVPCPGRSAGTSGRRIRPAGTPGVRNILDSASVIIKTPVHRWSLLLPDGSETRFPGQRPSRKPGEFALWIGNTRMIWLSTARSGL